MCLAIITIKRYLPSGFLLLMIGTLLPGNLNCQESVDYMQFIQIEDLSIAYRIEGSGPAIILLHGFTQDTRIWEDQFRHLSEDFTMLSWDAPGAGLSSDPPESQKLEDWADQLSVLMNELDIESAHILGLSWGGILAQVFYKRYLEKVQSLIFVGAYAGWTGSIGLEVAMLRFETCMIDGNLPPDEYMPGMFSDSVSQAVFDAHRTIMLDFHPEGFRLMARSCLEDTSPILPKIEVPTLLIWGEADKRSSIDIANQFREAIITSSLSIIENAGHVCNMERPAEFNSLVREFVLENEEE